MGTSFGCNCSGMHSTSWKCSATLPTLSHKAFPNGEEKCGSKHSEQRPPSVWGGTERGGMRVLITHRERCEGCWPSMSAHVTSNRVTSGRWSVFICVETKTCKGLHSGNYSDGAREAKIIPLHSMMRNTVMCSWFNNLVIRQADTTFYFRFFTLSLVL